MQISNTILNQQLEKLTNNNKNFNQVIENFQSILENVENTNTSNDTNISNDTFANTLKQLEQQVQQDEQMFKTFDFMQLLNQLMYGNNDEDEKNKIYKQLQDIASSVK